MQQHGIPLYSNGRMFMEGVMNSWLSCMDVKEALRMYCLPGMSDRMEQPTL